MTELEALRRVAEAARAFFDAWDHGQATLGAIAEMGRALAALRALPAPAEPDGEVVEVRAVVFANAEGAWTVYGNHCDEDEQLRDKCKRLAWDDEVLTATIRAHVPLPRVPEVVGEVW